MVKSIEFFDEKEGYLNKRNTKLILKDGKTEEEYKKAKEDKHNFCWEHSVRSVEDYFYKEVETDYMNERARNCLMNRKFEFLSDKINLIFGPNASGKSTIIKTIASYALCGSGMYFDGFTNAQKLHPADYPFSFSDLGDKYSQEKLYELIIKQAGNKAKIDWDGNPVYYHAFDKRRDYGSLDAIEDNILGGMGEQLNYMVHKNILSDGKQSFYIFSLLYKIAKSNPSLTTTIESTERRANQVNDTWAACFNNSIKYLKSKWCGKDTQNTILLDEIDKSLDLNNVAYIFKELLPELRSINNQQIIVISHSPLVLSKDICSDEVYNLISMDDDYTNKVKNLLSTLNF